MSEIKSSYSAPAVTEDLPAVDVPRAPPAPPAPATIPASKSAPSISQATRMQHRDVLARLETNIKNIVFWRDPVRSGAYFFLIMGLLILSRHYSLIQIVAACLTVATGVNLLYVNATVQSERILMAQQGVNPYQTLLEDSRLASLDRSHLHGYLDTGSMIAERLARRLARVVLVEDTKTSCKWLAIFFMTWKLASYVSGRTLAILATLAAFSLPVLYAMNKDTIDERYTQMEGNVQRQVTQLEQNMHEHWRRLSTSARFRLSKVGTTATDAKNTIQKTSVTTKKDE
ncbi:Reticulon-domain-containing protein [Gongronella butleri]|nr:Reticulon-domain-containing protein [Gongronella butleri]